MPAASTHVLFAEDLLETVPGLKERIERPNLYYIGAQGPDVLFFSRYSFLPGSLHYLGSRMHIRRTRELMMFLKRCAEEIPLLRSYYYGFAAHYALDSTAHSIIRWASQKEEECYGWSETEAHYRIEGDIDVWAFRRYGKDISDYDVHLKTKLNREETEALALLLKTVVSELYGEDHRLGEYREAVNGVSRITRQMKPGSELKYRTALLGEKLLHADHIVTGMMLMHKHDHGLFVFNEEGNEYEMPGRDGETDRRTFAEIYDDALEFGRRIILDLREEDIRYDFDGNTIRE